MIIFDINDVYELGVVENLYQIMSYDLTAIPGIYYFYFINNTSYNNNNKNMKLILFLLTTLLIFLNIQNFII